MPVPEFADLQTRSASLEDVAGFSTDGRTVLAPGVTEWADVFSVTPNLFDLLGVGAVVGRTSTDPERQTKPDRVAILTDGFWRRVFGGDPAIVGKRIRLAGRGAAGADDSYEVLGIVPWRVDLRERGQPVAGIRGTTEARVRDSSRLGLLRSPTLPAAPN